MRDCHPPCPDRLRVGLLIVAVACWAATANSSPVIDEVVFPAPLPWRVGVPNLRSNVSMAIASDNTPHIVFSRPDQAIVHAWRTNAGWASEVLDIAALSANKGGYPRIVFDSFGRTHVLFIDHAYNPPGPGGVRPQLRYVRQVTSGGPWSPLEPTTPDEPPLGAIDDLDLVVSADGLNVAYAASRSGNGAVLHQHRNAGGWSTADVPLIPYSGSASIALTADDREWLGTTSGVSAGNVVVITPGASSWLVERTILAGADRHVRMLGTSSDVGDLHVGFSQSFAPQPSQLRYWLRHSTGWHPVPLPVVETTSNGSTGDFRMAVAPGQNLPWFLTSRGNGGVSRGALLSVTYASGDGWVTEHVNDAPLLGYDYSDANVSELNAWISVDAQNQGHVVYQVLDTSVGGVDGFQLRYVRFAAPVPPALSVTGGGPSSPSLRLLSSRCVTDGRVRLGLGSAFAGAVRIDAIDIMGRVAHSEWRNGTGVQSRLEQPIELDLGALKPGVYLVRVASADVQASERVIVLR